MQRLIRTCGVVTLAMTAGWSLSSFLPPPVADPSPSLPADAITTMELPIEFPVVGNIEAVKQWHLGRVERVELTVGVDDIIVYIRTEDEVVRRFIGPRVPMGRLGRACGWLSTPGQTYAGKSDYVERMIAFDADENDRIIAVASLEPFNRDERALKRAFAR